MVNNLLPIVSTTKNLTLFDKKRATKLELEVPNNNTLFDAFKRKQSEKTIDINLNILKFNVTKEGANSVEQNLHKIYKANTKKPPNPKKENKYSITNENNEKSESNKSISHKEANLIVLNNELIKLIGKYLGCSIMNFALTCRKLGTIICEDLIKQIGRASCRERV